MPRPRLLTYIALIACALFLAGGASLVYADRSGLPYFPLDAYGASVAVVGDDPWYGDHYVTLIDGAQSLGAEDGVNATVSINASELGHDEMAFILWRFADPIVLNTESEYTIDYAGRCGGRGPGYCLSGLITDSVAFDGLTIAYGGGDPYHQHLDDVYAGTVVYGVYLGFSVYASEVSTFTVDYAHLSGDAYVSSTPTPTATGTATVVSTVIPNSVYSGNLCVTAQPNSTATPTQAIYQLTQPTPTPTRTPGGNDAGPGAGPTGTPNPSSPPITSDFASSLYPWMSTAYYSSTVWLAAPSQGGGDEGVAFIPYLTGANIWHPSYALFYTSGMIAPFRITGWFEAAPLPVGSIGYLRVWGINSSGNTSPTLLSSTQVTSDWRQWSVKVLASYDQIALTAYFVQPPGEGDVDPLVDPLAGRAGIRVDNIAAYFGDIQIDGSYPLCPDVPYTDTLGIGTKTCTIIQASSDVLTKYCPAPSSALDIGAWISYLWCRMARYFMLLPENSAQVEAVSKATYQIEPFASFSESNYILNLISGRTQGYIRNYKLVERPVINWTGYLNWEAVLHPQLPTPSTTVVNGYQIARCRFGTLENTISDAVLGPMCFVVNALDDSGLSAPLQLLIDVLALWAVLNYILTTWMARNGEGK